MYAHIHIYAHHHHHHIITYKVILTLRCPPRLAEQCERAERMQEGVGQGRGQGGQGPKKAQTQQEKEGVGGEGGKSR